MCPPVEMVRKADRESGAASEPYRAWTGGSIPFVDETVTIHKHLAATDLIHRAWRSIHAPRLSKGDPRRIVGIDEHELSTRPTTPAPTLTCSFIPVL